MTIHTVTQVHINKTNLHDTNLHTFELNDSDLSPNQVLLKIDRFGFSANNITYAALGDKMGYWGFFPADDQHGMMPVWGFAQVVASNHEDVEVGKRVYGYLPFANHLIVEPSKLTDNGFFDGISSRKSINAVYDHYLFVDKDPAYVETRETWQMNFRPLFMTSFVLGMHAQDNCHEGQLIISSASSKTALGTAAFLKAVENKPFKVVGLTSESNKTFVEKTGCYDEVFDYQTMQGLEAGQPGWLLDFAANGDIHEKLSEILGDNLRKISLIGATDWSVSNKPSMKAPNSSVFFAPSEVQMRVKEMGQGKFMQEYANAWLNFAKIITPLMDEKEIKGNEQLIELYLRALNNQLSTSTLVDATF